ncbi:unnamed protein product [Mycena citricolor]|uniref:L-serine ammonia-lyase n=2 Tax=Mycena citricolor TaxID=2018698 RepID=A0AAD2K553_9AGAR|nr:unnamed protein product [Mycena citricolor]
MSFKSRGISNFAKHAKEDRGETVHLVIASGGNAGIAAACAARSLNVKCTVFIPAGASPAIVKFLQNQDARTVVGGVKYSDALEAAKQLASQDVNAVLVPAYDDPVVWEGHASLIHETVKQLPEPPSVILCSVGGGGLLGGVIAGCAQVGWDSVPIVALEAIGTDCFYHTMALNRRGDKAALPPGVTVVHDEIHNVDLAHFSSFHSKASGSLGASQPAAGVVKMALERSGPVFCVTVPDELSMQAACAFVDDHKTMVELACSTTLVAAYNPELLDRIVPQDGKRRTALFVVCGGFKVSLEDLAGYAQHLQTYSGPLNAFCDGEELKIKF